MPRIDPGLARPAAAPDARPEGRDATMIATRPAGRRRALPPARSCSPPTRPQRTRAGQARSSWCAIETSPEDIHGMHAADGILTARGGMTSHAAVVARGMGKPCVVGARRDPHRLRKQHHDRRRARSFEEGDMHHHRRHRRPGAAPARCR
ncbi:MAG: PEP-utilizing enzyme [Rhodopseudomonas palustris]|nr:PEP-utilizing enzyme [Rhodopseudomonas palustris]